MIIKLPRGLRLTVTNNNNLSCPAGTKATLLCDEEFNTEAFSSNVFVMIDGDSMASALPFTQCDIIVEDESASKKETFHLGVYSD